MEHSKKKSGDPANIQVSLKKATTDLIVLTLLREKPRYTYELMQEVERRSGGVIAFNTMYLTIYRLRDFGYIREHEKVVSADNRVQIYFAITETGRDYLERITWEYRRYTDALDRVLEAGTQEGET